MLVITPHLSLADSEYELTAVRSQGAGGQNVNKVATAIQLRFDIAASSLPEEARTRLLAMQDHRITDDGVVIIKAQEHRSQEQNRDAALARLKELLLRSLVKPKKRKPTRPSRGAKERRLTSKSKLSQKKALRRKPAE